MLTKLTKNGEKPKISDEIITWGGGGGFQSFELKMQSLTVVCFFFLIIVFQSYSLFFFHINMKHRALFDLVRFKKKNISLT